MNGTILCIDDEPIGLRVRKLLLETRGYEVLTATSGREGLELFAAHPVSAVVLDYAMPEMNGDEVAAALKRIDPGVKILLFSAYVQFPDDVMRHVDGFAVKGEHPDALFTALKKLLS